MSEDVTVNDPATIARLQEEVAEATEHVDPIPQMAPYEEKVSFSGQNKNVQRG